MTPALILAAEDEPNPLVPHIPEIIVGTIAFLLLYWVLKTRAFPIFEKTYRERTERIEGGLRRAEEAQREAQETLERYRAALADAREEAARIREEAREQGGQIVEEMRTAAQHESARIIARGEEQLRAERQQVVTELRGEIGRLAVDLAGRIVGESLEDPDRQRRVVDRFLNDLEGQPAAAGAGTGGTGSPPS